MCDWRNVAQRRYMALMPQQRHPAHFVAVKCANYEQLTCKITKKKSISWFMLRYFGEINILLQKNYSMSIFFFNFAPRMDKVVRSTKQKTITHIIL